MSDFYRYRRAPLVGLVLVGLTLAVAAAIALWLSSAWQVEVAELYSTNISSSTGRVAPGEQAAIDRLSNYSYQLFQISGPMLMGAMAALLALLGVLAWRWQRKPAEPDQATAAS